MTGKTFMEVEQTRALTFLGMFGNAGGYVGMFLGCALMQLPDFLKMNCSKLKSLIH